MKLTKNVQAEILAHAEKEAPRECCGLVLQAGRKQLYRRCGNAAAEPTERFEISGADWLCALDVGKVIAIVHSHPQGEPWLSGADRQAQAEFGLPWVLAVSGSLKVFEPVPHLRGRVFDYGRADCYSLLADAYHLAGIDLPSVRRGQIDDDAAQGRFLALAEAAGFYRVRDLQPGDVVLTEFDGLASHVLLYLGNGEMLHHAFGQLSRRDGYGPYWQRHTHSIWRHRQWRPEMLQAVLNDLACRG
ncbi:C40 family peptidase [Eikenella longinqua]|nr:C40 family peptidase [Eikenella longinqua]